VIDPLYDVRAEDLNSPFAIVGVRKRRRDSPLLVYQDRLLAVKYKDTSRPQSDRLKITLDNKDGLLFGDDLLMRKGTLVSFKFGYPGYSRDVGDFVLKSRKSSGGHLVLECHEAKRTRHSRTPEDRQWSQIRRSDVATQVMTRMGFAASEIDVEMSDLVLPMITQHKIADYPFLESLARAEGKEFWTDQSGGHWKSAQRNQRPARKYRYRKGIIAVGNLAGEPKIEDFGHHCPGRITLRGIDPLTGEEYVVKASDPESGSPEERVRGLIKLAESDALLSPDEGNTEAAGNDGFEIEENIGARSKAEAKNVADSLYKQYRYGALKIKVPLIGDPWLLSRQIIECWGIGPAVDGYFWTKELVHELAPARFFKTTAELTKDGLNKKNKVKKPKDPPGQQGLDQNLEGRG